MDKPALGRFKKYANGTESDKESHIGCFRAWSAYRLIATIKAVREENFETCDPISIVLLAFLCPSVEFRRVLNEIT